MRLRNIVKPMAAVMAAFLLAGCASWLFGETDTDGQLLYRKSGEFVYASIAVENYAKKQGADPRIVEDVCGVEAELYGALSDSLDSYADTGQRLPMSFFRVTKLIGTFSLQVFGTIGMPDDPVEAAGRTVILVSVGAVSFEPMREFRKRFLKPTVEAMVAAGRSPTAEEWAYIRGLVDEQHAAIAAACG